MNFSKADIISYTQKGNEKTNEKKKGKRKKEIEKELIYKCTTKFVAS